MRTEETVDELCRKWQTILRLRDWDIHVELFLAREFSGEDSQGRILCCWIYNVLNRRDVTADNERILYYEDPRGIMLRYRHTFF